jgi:hypothetical protein
MNTNINAGQNRNAFASNMLPPTPQSNANNFQTAF